MTKKESIKKSGIITIVIAILFLLSGFTKIVVAEPDVSISTDEGCDELRFVGWYVFDDHTEYETISNPGFVVDHHGDPDLYYYEPSGGHGLMDHSMGDEEAFSIIEDYIRANIGEGSLQDTFSYDTGSTLDTFEKATYTYALAYLMIPPGYAGTFNLRVDNVDDGISVLVNGHEMGYMKLGETTKEFNMDVDMDGNSDVLNDGKNTIIIILADDSASEKYIHGVQFLHNGQLMPATPDNTITGYVTNSYGQQLSDVTVTVSGPSSGSDITDSSGFYSIACLPNGVYSVTATKICYNDGFAQVGVTGNQVKNQDFVLTADQECEPEEPPPDAPRRYGRFAFLLGYSDIGVHVVDVEEQQYIGQLQFEEPDEPWYRDYNSIALSKDGRHLYTVYGSSGFAYITKVDIKERSLIDTIMIIDDEVDYISEITVSPDGQYAYISSYSPIKILKINLDTEEYEVLYDAGPDSTVQVRDLEISPDGSILYVVTASMNIYRIDTASGQFLTTLDVSFYDWGQGCFIQDDSLYHVSLGGDVVNVFDRNSGGEPVILRNDLGELFAEFIGDIAVAPGGKFYLPQSQSDSVYIIDKDTGEIENTLEIPSAAYAGFGSIEMGETWGQTIECEDISTLGKISCYMEEGVHESDLIDWVGYWVEG